MLTYLVAVGLIFALLLAGIAVERLYRRFAARNPQLGPFRDTGCGSCSCHGDSCAAPTSPPGQARTPSRC